MASDNRVAKWYFGGMASAGAACCTHPLDLLKVHLQTAVSKTRVGSASGSGHIGLVGNTVVIIKNQGVLALYNGLTASLLRQLTYSTTRFGIYEVAKQKIATKGEKIPFYKAALLAGISGAAGGLIGLSQLLINLLTY
jgi:dicarboxylate transporter 10